MIAGFCGILKPVETFGALGKDYVKRLDERAADSHVYRSFQLIGLELAEILRDARHKTLYIKLAKDHPDHERLLALAKDIASRQGVKNKGAYFMRLLFDGNSHE